MTRVVELKPSQWWNDRLIVHPFTISAVHLVDHPEGWIDIQLITVCGHRETVWSQEDQHSENNLQDAETEVARITALLWPGGKED